MLARPGTCLQHIRLGHRFGINGHELVGPPQRNHRRPQALQQLRQQIARDAGMLIKAQAHALQAATGEEAEITRQIQGRSALTGPGQLHRQRTGRQAHRRRGNARLIRLGNLARDAIKLDAVAVKRNVAARNHHARNTLHLREIRQRRCWNRSAVIDRHPRRNDCRSTGRSNGRTAWTQIDRQRHPLRPRRQRLDERRRIGKADLIGHIDHPPAGTAGAKADAAGVHHGADSQATFHIVHLPQDS